MLAQRDYVVLSVPDRNAELVIGLRWHTVLGSRLEARARQKAREAKATHYAHAGEGSECVGTVSIHRRDRAARGVTRYCAALAFAAGHPRGRAALCIALPDERVWLVAIRDGRVVGQTDRVYGSLDEAHASLRDLQARSDDVAVYGLSVDGAGEPYALEMLIAELGPACELHSAGFAMPAIPRPIVVALLGVLLAFGARSGLDVYRARRGPPMPMAVDPVAEAQAYQARLSAALLATRVDTQAGLDKVLAAIAALPGNVGGWGLRQASCVPRAPDGWRCVASYLRDSRRATNASFIAERPADWSQTWRPLGAVEASFEIPTPAGHLEPAALSTRAKQDEDTLSTLQRILPAFASIQVGEAVPWRFETASSLAVPAGAMPAIDERPISIEGPWRSLALLPPSLSDHVAWRRIDLQLADADQVGLNRSRLMASLHGVLYGHR